MATQSAQGKQLCDSCMKGDNSNANFEIAYVCTFVFEDYYYK